MRQTSILLVFLLFSTVCAINVHRITVNENEEIFYRHVKAESPDAVTFALAKIFQNHMVLQKEPAKANIYGFSPNVGETVTVELVTSTKKLTYTTKVESGTAPNVGVWIVALDPQAADTAADINVTSQGTTLSLTDVIFGDVWICSGQSNMQFPVSQMLDADAEKADVNYPKIRLVTVADVESTTPLDDISQFWQTWTRPDSAKWRSAVQWVYLTQQLNMTHWFDPSAVSFGLRRYRVHLLGNVGGFSALCWVYGKNIHKALGYSIGLIHSSWGGTPAEAWSSPAALAKCGNTLGAHTKNRDYLLGNAMLPKDKHRLRNPTDKSVLWNAMIHPLLKTSITGVIWYQGESDTGGTMQDHYNCTFPIMITDWRENFNKASSGQTSQSFPFGFVQLAPYNNDPDNAYGFPDLRWHQTADVGYVPNPKMLNTFMAVAMDLPDFDSPYGSIHPRDKKDVGDRLSLGGLAVAYGKQEVYQGPYPSKGEVTSSGFKITYGSSSTLEIRTTTGFELLCSGRWVAAPIKSNDATTVTLQSVCNAGETVKAVRYAWRESPCSFMKCAVYEKVNGLPGPPFILSIATNADGQSFLDF